MKFRKRIFIVILFALVFFHLPVVYAGIVSLPLQDHFDSFESYWEKGDIGDSAVTDSYWYATDYGSGASWHGASIQVNFTNPIGGNEDFYVTINISASSDNQNDVTCRILIEGYDDNGNQLFWMGWGDMTAAYKYGYFQYRDVINSEWVYCPPGDYNERIQANTNLTLIRDSGYFKAYLNNSLKGTGTNTVTNNMAYIILRNEIYGTQTEPEYQRAELCYVDRIDLLSPNYNIMGINNTVMGESTEIKVNFSDNYGLSHWIIEHNNSGVLMNETSNDWVDSTWAVYVFTLNETADLVVAKFYANDTSDNWIATIQLWIKVSESESQFEYNLLTGILVAALVFVFTLNVSLKSKERL